MSEVDGRANLSENDLAEMIAINFDNRYFYLENFPIFVYEITIFFPEVFEVKIFLGVKAVNS